MLSFLLTIADDSDKEKVERIYNKFHDDMMRFACYTVRKLNVQNVMKNAEDVVQNAFIKIIKNINKINFSLGDDSVRSYIFTIVCNEANNLLKQDGGSFVSLDDLSEVLGMGNETDFIIKLDIKNRYENVVRAIRNLDEKYSSLLVLAYCHGYTVKEISDETGILEKTIYTRLERGRKLLLEALESGGDRDE